MADSQKEKSKGPLHSIVELVLTVAHTRGRWLVTNVSSKTQ